MEFPEIENMTIQEFIDFYEEIDDDGGVSIDPSDERAIAIKQEATKKAFGDGVSGVSDADIIAKLKTML
tara:strand:- start:1049 stop:1255 length:207 start_codon:yes stop_codon:yes gene_type:complete